MNILIPNTTREEIESIFEFARCGANNSMIGIHKKIIQITDEDLEIWSEKIKTNCSMWNIPPKERNNEI